MQDPVLNKAMEEWEKSSADPKVREEYLARRKDIRAISEITGIPEEKIWRFKIK